jgi:hypothetical protein
MRARRRHWRRVLDAEMTRWSGKTSDELIEALRQPKNYEVEFEGRTFQVEVQLLENTERYPHVGLAVDDGALPAAIVPVSDSFICAKPCQDP